MPKMAKTAEQKQFDNISDALHGIQRRSGYTQRDIADLTGWSKGKVEFIINKPDRAKACDIRRLAIICGYSCKLIFDEIEEKAPDYRK